VIPRNKDRPEARQAFAGKCSAYLQRGIGVIVLDIVTTRQANMDNELIDLLRLDQTFLQPAEVSLDALAYRPTRQENLDQVETWTVPLQLTGMMPVLPLALRGACIVPLEMEATCAETRQRCRP
jgi:hypothetical protein